jgi:hypothetical protein
MLCIALRNTAQLPVSRPLLTLAERYICTIRLTRLRNFAAGPLLRR